MTDDLERDLRAMLTARSADVRSVPPGLLSLDASASASAAADASDAFDAPDPDGDGELDAEVIDLGLRRSEVMAVARRRWPLLLAVAVVAAVLAGVLTTLTGGSPNDTPPAQRTSGPSRPTPTIQRTTCRIADSAQWNTSVRAASFTPTGVTASEGLGVESVTADGDVLVQFNRPDDPVHRSGVDFGSLSVGSGVVRGLGFFGIPLRNNASFSLYVDVDNATRTAVVTVSVGVANRTESTSAIYAVNLDTGHRTRLLSVPRSQSRTTNTSQGFVQDSTVYWEVDPLHPNRIYAVPVSGGTPGVVAAGNELYLEKSALGVRWNDIGTVDEPATVPAVVARHARADTDISDDFASYVTDGTSYAWSTGSGALDWYSPAAGRVVSFAGLLGAPGTTQSFVNAVAGPLVFFQNRAGDEQLILDTRTGALVPITSGGTMVGAPDGLAVGDPLLDAPPVAQGELMRLDTSTSAPLRC